MSPGNNDCLLATVDAFFLYSSLGKQILQAPIHVTKQSDYLRTSFVYIKIVHGAKIAVIKPSLLGFLTR